MKKITSIALIIILVGLVSANSNFAVEAKNSLPVKSVEPVTKQVSEPPLLSQSVTPSVDSLYGYNPVGKPDPFQPFVEEEIVAKKNIQKKKTNSIYPLQRVDIDQFRLVGIGGDRSRRVAVVVEDTTKKFYPLVIGTRIGVNNGKVVEILPDRVIVAEPGRKMIILKLHKN